MVYVGDMHIHNCPKIHQKTIKIKVNIEVELYVEIDDKILIEHHVSNSPKLS
jgi:hypothetical protein